LRAARQSNADNPIAGKITRLCLETEARSVSEGTTASRIPTFPR
jgi:hypothetical protein